MLFSRNVQLGPPLKLSSWRKIAIGSWRTAGDPSVYGIMELDADKALRYLEGLNSKNSIKITLTHLIGKAVANVYAKHPHINCILRFGKIYPRESVDLFFQVATDKQGKDLSGVTIRAADKKTITGIAQEMHHEVSQVRHKGDPRFSVTKKTMSLIPGFLSPFILNFLGFIMYGLNIWSPLFGAPKDAFGSVMITNVGSLGLPIAFAPLIPYARVPLLIAISAVTDRPVVKNGQITIAKMVDLGITLDHRLIDGLHASHMAKTLQAFFEDPEKNDIALS